MTIDTLQASDEIRSICPVTGLCETHRPAWQITAPGRDFKAIISILGNRILKGEIHGFITGQDSRDTSRLTEEIIAGHLDPAKGFVQIFDMKQNTGFSLKSRQKYKQTIEQRRGVLGHIFYNTALLFNISVRLARKFNQLDFGIHLVNDYAEAEALAQKLISRQIPISHHYQVDTTLKHFSAIETNEYCPVSGLPVSTRPEWTDVPLGPAYSATFKIIGTGILLSEAKGRPNEVVFEGFFQLRARVIKEAFGKDGPFVEIKNYESARTPSRTMRRLFIKHMSADADRTVGFIGYHVPIGVKFSINLGCRLIPHHCPVMIVSTYEQAVNTAIAAMDHHKATGQIPAHNFFSLKKNLKSRGVSYTPYQIDQSIDDVLHFLGNINWEIDGLDASMGNLPSGHLFTPIFEAIALIKSDLDDLTSERKRAEAEAVRSSENLQKTQAQLIQFEKMAALGSLVAGVSHEISTPLGISVTASSFLHQKMTEFQRKHHQGQLTKQDIDTYVNQTLEASTMISDNLNRASELVSSFKQISVDQSNEIKRTFNLRQYTESIIQSLTPRFKRTAHTIHLDCPDHITVESYPGALSQILTNLMINSLTHGFDGRKASGDIRLRMWTSPGTLFIDYRDNGHGMSPETVKHIYDPFYTTKRSSGGTGLGMHIVYNIVTTKLKGQIHCAGSPGQGARFLLKLPH